MHELTEGHHTDRLTNRAAGGLLIAFLTAVILVLTLANTIPATADDADTGGQHHQGAVSR
ncbi:hypothetical protein [Agromyces mariniharenae]|uniref:Uncharacterized protein n=1 Tax=Agromyces mariniharenae TaxID=2604423 RepID=A0A5S4UZG8_9MICO|nr:hypothetical protein [Agromyces mariniharenae]TYL50501.1 hypothetical protein FYC51_14985 [Agromyces mariniharenae]